MDSDSDYFSSSSSDSTIKESETAKGKIASHFDNHYGILNLSNCKFESECF